MHEITGDQDSVQSLLEDTIDQLQKYEAAQNKKGGAKAMSASKKKAASPDQVSDVWQKGLERLEGKKSGARAAGVGQPKKKPEERAVETAFAPRDQILALFQSAMDEYLDEAVGPVQPDAAKKAAKKGSSKAASAKKSAAKKPAATLDNFKTGGGNKKKGASRAANIFAQFGNLDPRWVQVAAEKAKSWFKGKHKFTQHKSASDFRFKMENETTVAIVGDWGGGNAAAQAVAQQIKKLNPNHVIHLGDVYYSGTPKEVQERFLKYWPSSGDPGKSFALNSNHEMYSGGYGYFDYTLKQFKQPASYFSLANDNWRFIGLDTGYDEHDLHDPQADWLKGQLTGNGPKTILLSHHQLFSAYENTDASKLRNKIQPFLSQVYGWIWGHEHLAIVYEQHEGIRAVCLGNGCFPYGFPKGTRKVPIKWIDERKSDDPDYPGGHTFALLKIKGGQIDIDYIDHKGDIGFSDTWK